MGRAEQATSLKVNMFRVKRHRYRRCGRKSGDVEAAVNAAKAAARREMQDEIQRALTNIEVYESRLRKMVRT